MEEEIRAHERRMSRGKKTEGKKDGDDGERKWARGSDISNTSHSRSVFTPSVNREGAVRRRAALTLAGILAGWFSSISLLRCKIHMRLSCCDLA